jgi:hypothetical protein
MNERLLQFIWQFQYYHSNELAVTTGEFLQIISPGQYNSNQGPDFLDAKIRIGDTTWAGSIELHIKTSDWNKHAHTGDINYNNVILHVVWQHDTTINAIPVLELQPRVSNHLLQRYEELMHAQGFIPCEKMIATVRDITLKSWKERLLAERLLRKAGIAESFLQQNNHHWEETFWWMLARNFGVKINADAFEAMAKTIPVTLLAKHKQQIHQLEALLLGQAGLLEGSFKEDYPLLLQREYQFLAKKYQLSSVHLPVQQLRMRPGNFPVVRLAELAMLVQESVHLFSRIREAKTVTEVKKWFAITANDYWHYHYQLDKPSVFKKKKPGASMIDNIIINTVIPLLFAYGKYQGEQQYQDKALQWLEEIKAESNAITRGFIAAGLENENAFDSQALIELKNEYCIKKRCLECGIGASLIKSAV